MGRPKQFIELLGRPALYHTLRALEDSPAVDKVYVVGDRERIEKLAEEASISKYAGCAEPGEARSLSTRSGLLLCEDEEEAIVLIHDGSRCLVTPELIGRVVEAARGGGDGVVPTLPVSDTIKVAENGSVSQTLDRTKLHAAQTPQAFRLGVLRRIYAAPEKVLRSATDDAVRLKGRASRNHSVKIERRGFVALIVPAGGKECGIQRGAFDVASRSLPLFLIVRPG